MNTCDTCKHWDKQSGSVDLPYYEGLGECMKASALQGKSSRREDIFMLNTDHDEANLVTGPKFGCVHHELKADG